MLFSAAVNRTWLSRTNAPAMVKPRRPNVVPAMATASKPGESENSFTLRVGSGMICSAGEDDSVAIGRLLQIRTQELELKAYLRGLNFQAGLDQPKPSKS